MKINIKIDKESLPRPELVVNIGPGTFFLWGHEHQIFCRTNEGWIRISDGRVSNVLYPLISIAIPIELEIEVTP